MKKKIATILSTSILITSGTFLNVNANVYMKDINGHWAETSITKFLNKGYIKGYEDDTFRPDNTITRAEFVTIFNRVFNLKKFSNKVFDDTKNHRAKNQIDIAYTNGICLGKSPTEFAPDDKITREESAKMISNYLNLSEKNIDKLKTYKDYKSVSSWAINDVEGVLEKEYMIGYDDFTFKPLNYITRSETVLMLNRVNNSSENSLTPIEKKIISNNWINGCDIVNINKEKIEFNFGFHEGLTFYILDKDVVGNRIDYKVHNNENNATPFDITISIEGDKIKIVCNDSIYSDLSGDFFGATNEQIIKLAHEMQDGLIYPGISYDKEYCINNYQNLRLRDYKITLDEVKSFYMNNKN